MKVSKETQVGALTAIAITILVLGYNYLSGKDDLFYNGKTFHVVYDNVDGLTGSNPVMFSGIRVGAVESVELDINTLKTHVSLDISKRGFKVPKNSIAKIYDTDLFGAKGVEIVLSGETEMADHGDTLLSETSISLVSSVTKVLNPITTKLNSILGALDTLTGNGQLEETLKELPSTVVALKRTLNTADDAMRGVGPKLRSILTTVDSVMTSLDNNKTSLTNAMANLENITDDMAKANLKETIAQTNKALSEFSTTLAAINAGEGTLGKLAKDEALYDNLNKAAKDLDILLKDLNKHPDKYLSIPFTKGRQKKAKEASSKEDYQK